MEKTPYFSRTNTDLCALDGQNTASESVARARTTTAGGQDLQRHLYGDNENTTNVYPSIKDSTDEEVKDTESQIIMVAAATLPTAAAEAYVETDDPAMRKMLEEERLINYALLESLKSNLKSENSELDSKLPAEEVDSIINNSYHKIDEARFGEAAEQLNMTVRNAIPTGTTLEATAAAEATILDSESISAMRNWENESSQEATILHTSIDHVSTWTTQDQGGELFCEEISVVGRDEAEATIVNISEEIHPADLDADGVRAELIGRDYTNITPLNNTPQCWHEDLQQDSQENDNNLALALSTSLDDQVNSEADVIAVNVNDRFLQTNEVRADVVVNESIHSRGLNEDPSFLDLCSESPTPIVGLSLPLVNAVCNIEVDNSTSMNHAEDIVSVTGITQQTFQDQENSNSILIAEPDFTNTTNFDASTTTGNMLENNGNQATVISITEEIHPADLDLASAQAEFVGEDHTRSISTEEQQNTTSIGLSKWNIVGPAFASNNEVTVEDAQITSITLSEDIHPADLRGSGVQAEYVGNDYSHIGSVERVQVPEMRGPIAVAGTLEHVEVSQSSTEAQVQVLPLITPTTNLNSLETHDQNIFAQEVDVLEQSIGQEPIQATADNTHLSSAAQLTEWHQPVESEQKKSTDDQEDNHQNWDNQPQQSGRLPHQVLSNVARGRNTMMRTTSLVMEKLFGSQGNITVTDEGFPLMPRTPLPSSVFPSETTGMWVATVNTNQKAVDSENIIEASKSLKAFSVSTKKQAESLAKAWAPPTMMNFSDNPFCFICNAKFAVFKRPCHCRNCGVCICSGCTAQWPSKMVPETYNVKNESMVNVCKSCDWLCTAFRVSLLEGDLDHSIAIHATGNVNLTNPFANVKGELFYPVHCAVLGGNLSLLKWLVDTHCCPLRSIRICATIAKSSERYTPILTSRGRSLLGIAMEKEHIDLVKYLVVEKGMDLSKEKGIEARILIKILNKTLHALHVPSGSFSEGYNENTPDSGFHGPFNESLSNDEISPAAVERISNLSSDETLKAD